MKTVFSLALLALTLLSCKKTTYSTLPASANQIKQITSTSFEIDEQFHYSNGLLKTYSLDLFGSRKLEYNILYDNLKRPKTIVKENQEFAHFYYNGNTVSVYSDDGIADSLVYTMDRAGRILKRVSYDNFYKTMLKNGSKTYSYDGNNLIKIEGRDFNTDGSIKFSFTETASYDEGKNAFGSLSETTVLMEFIFQFFPERVFAVNSQNNATRIRSDHSSDGFILMQNPTFNTSGYPESIATSFHQFGIIESDVIIYDYN